MIGLMREKCQMAWASPIFTEFSLSICKAYKEIPGLPEGKFDREAIFQELVKNDFM